MAIVHQSVATASGTGTSVTINAPTGVASGDLLLAWFWHDTAISADPSGWTLRGGSSATNGALYTKIAGGSEPGSYTWTLGSSGAWQGGISRFSGVNATTPIDAGPVFNGAIGSPNNVPAVTTATANAMVVGGVAVISTAAAVSPPAALTERWELSGTELAAAVQAVAGSTGTQTWTFTPSAGSLNEGFLTALRPGGSTVTGAGIASSAAMGVATVSLGAIHGVGIPSTPVMGRATLTSGLTLVGKGIAPTAGMGAAMFNRDSDPQELIFTWAVNQRARAIRFVFETTEPMAKFRVRSLEVWLRATGKQ